MKKRKRLGIDTDVWALIGTDGSVRGGDYKLRVFWTKATAKRELNNFPDCRLARVRIIEQREGSV